jgi:hypothetical protein
MEKATKILETSFGTEIDHLMVYIRLFRTGNLQLRLYINSRWIDSPFKPWLGQKIKNILKLLKCLRRKIAYEIVDTRKLTYRELLREYEYAAHQAIKRKFKVREVFWDSRLKFGDEVPALLVYNKNGNVLIDVYPKEGLILMKEIEDFLHFMAEAKKMLEGKDNISRKELVETIVKWLNQKRARSGF